MKQKNFLTMIRRLQDILSDIYNTPNTTLEDEYKFWKSNGQQKYFVERILKEINRRKKENNIPDTPQSNRLLYVIKCNKFYKIGITDNINYRVTSLQIGNPYKLGTYLCSYFDNAEDVEKELHIKFKKKHVRGEWFELNKDDLDYLKELFSE